MSPDYDTPKQHGFCSAPASGKSAANQREKRESVAIRLVRLFAKFAAHVLIFLLLFFSTSAVLAPAAVRAQSVVPCALPGAQWRH
jgi:fatty acid desaturase